MNQKTKEIIYKILLLGNNFSGKTCFMIRCVENTYRATFLSTIGLDYRTKKVILNNGATAKIQIWDTASADRYDHITRQYFYRTNGFILMYNMTRRESFEKAAYWLREIRNFTDNNNIVLVGNHADIDDSYHYYQKREISREEGQKFAEDNNLLFFETSNLTGLNVNECFDALINKIYENDPNRDNIELELGLNRPGKRGCLK